jgi:hypothetical protein
LEKFPNFRPKLVVGRGGWLGMDWDSDGGQQEAIQDFNSGRCNLLVTNVNLFSLLPLKRTNQLQGLSLKSLYSLV